MSFHSRFEELRFHEGNSRETRCFVVKNRLHKRCWIQYWSVGWSQVVAWSVCNGIKWTKQSPFPSIPPDNTIQAKQLHTFLDNFLENSFGFNEQRLAFPCEKKVETSSNIFLGSSSPFLILLATLSKKKDRKINMFRQSDKSAPACADVNSSPGDKNSFYFIHPCGALTKYWNLIKRNSGEFKSFMNNSSALIGSGAVLDGMETTKLRAVEGSAIDFE